MKVIKPMTKVERDGAGETYETVRRLIRRVVQSFHSRHGGDRQELESQAGELFLYAYRTHRLRKGRFTKRLAYVIYNGLLDRHRKAAKERLNVEGGDLNDRPGPSRFSLRRFLNELSDDARTVAALVLEGVTEPVRDTWDVLWYLIGMGWTARRAARGINEVKGALS